MKRALRLAVVVYACASAGIAQTSAPAPKTSETIEVTATRVAEDVMVVAASVTVIDGDELRARNANDLQSALAMVSGVSVAPGGDGGPAGSVVELWGLRELDAFLLVVDGVPWGGAFNPDLPTLDLTDVDRIEVLRGSSPVMYGATSFAGVVHVIHRAPGAPGLARITVGSYGSASVAGSIPLMQLESVQQSLTANAERRRLRDDDAGFDRLHALYRAAMKTGSGNWRFDADLAAVRQSPNSPHPRVGRVLSSDVPLDSNHNPRNARLDQDRVHVVGGFDGKLGGTPWVSTLAVSHSSFGIVRGFLTDVSDSAPNAAGYSQDRSITDVYFDTHIVRAIFPSLRLIAGIDHLYGSAHAASATFNYFAPLRGGRGNRSGEVPVHERFDARDRRNFSGLYASSQWTATPRLIFDIGMRLNHTNESRDNDGPDGPMRASRSFNRLSGSVGVSYTLFQQGSDALALFGDYRNTFKPAAIDFGPEAEATILRPETATSYEAGVKGRFDGGRVSWTTSAFLMNFRNLLTAANVNGTPVLQNSGRQRFRGGEAEIEYAFADSVRAQVSYSLHDSRFTDFVQEFDPGVPTQLAGKRLELTPRKLAGAGLSFSPAQGFNANLLFNYSGERWLNKRNTALARPYNSVSAGVGYRMSRGELRLDGRNLNNSRAPVAESELGDAQYYLLPARSAEFSYRYHF